jgi:hypothetical protein
MACLRDPSDCCHWQWCHHTERVEPQWARELRVLIINNLQIRRHHERGFRVSTSQFSTSPPSNPRACPLLRRRSTLLPLRPLPTGSLHNFRLANSYSFLPNRNRIHTRNHPSKHNNRSLSTHGLHILPHLDSCHHHFLDIFMRFPRLPLPPVNCSSLEAKHTVTTVNTMIYM